jgi:mannose-1-phosphate guanylyltransferase/mannose-6-phosphate isomerase
VILAGGSGTRLWPLSRTHYPKQFLQLLGEHTLLQQTVLRLDNLIPPERLWIITGTEQAHIVRSQLSGLFAPDRDKVHILVEPIPKNTAAAIGLAAIHALRQDPEATLVVLPADHWVEQQNVFCSLLGQAAKLAQQEMLVTLGVVPTYPATGYGYIRGGEPVAFPQQSLSEALIAYKVEQFVEKPDLPTARRYLASGAYFWNAGIFLWKASTILEEIARYLSLLAQGLEEIAPSLGNDTVDQTLASVYSKLESVSIDYGILEKSVRLVVVPADMGWSDLGDWTTIHRLSPKDARGNTLSTRVLDIESENSFVYSDRRRVATIGLKNTMVVDAEDALLICPADRVQEVKVIAHHLQSNGEEAAHVSRTVHRPWGTYTVLEEGAGFKVKRLMVYPGAALSLQLHHHRSEQWVVVRGVAQITNGDLEGQLHVGQSSYVPQETIHRLSNPGSELLEIIEVQTGSYLGEDDIVRFADLYQRLSP